MGRLRTKETVLPLGKGEVEGDGKELEVNF
jgi:hypothetical protein